MTGLADNIDARFAELFSEFTDRHQPHPDKNRRDEQMIWQGIDKTLEETNLTTHVRPLVISGPRYEHEFKCSWENGAPQVLEPVSFDLAASERIANKANTWTGRLYNLGASDFQMTAVVAKPHRPGLTTAFRNARDILADLPNVRGVIDEKELPDFAQDIWRDIKEHENRQSRTEE